jgi:methyltransferase
MMYFILFMVLLILLRLIELAVSDKNEIWLKKNGAVEYGRAHYPYIILLHVLFIASLIIEYILRPSQEMNTAWLTAFIILIILKIMVISSLGNYWNTRIYRIPGTPLVNKGVYKYFKHPNYAIVVLEIALIPLIFHLYYTAAIFSFLNLIMLYVRISEENKALNS